MSKLKHMRKTTLYVFMGLGMLCSIYSCTDSKKTADETPSAMTPEDMVKRGEFLVQVGGCNDCHTPKTMTEKGPALDMSKMLSGHQADAQLPPYEASMVGPWILFYPQLTAAVGPWGISFAANLTPHATGLGNWTGETFMTAIKTGKHMGMENGRPIMPPMPWQAIAQMQDDDLKAIFAYLKSIPAVDNMVPAYMPPGM